MGLPSNTSSLVTTPGRSSPGIGGRAGTEPVAIRIWSAVIWLLSGAGHRDFMSCDSSSTSQQINFIGFKKLFGAAPRSCKQSCAFGRGCAPYDSLFQKSQPKLLGVLRLMINICCVKKCWWGCIPCSSRCRLHPGFSITAVLRPNCAARIAATYPPGPAPITAS